MAYTITLDKLKKDIKTSAQTRALVPFFEQVSKSLPEPDFFFGDDKKKPKAKSLYVVKVSKTNWESIVKKIKQYSKKTTDKVDYEISDFKIRFQITGKRSAGLTQDAKTTAMQERASLLMFEYIIEENKYAPREELAKLYPSIDDEWYISFIAQADALKKWWKFGKGYSYYHDGGFMNFITKKARELGKPKKDDRNPADVWLVKRSVEQKILKEIEKIDNIDQLNDYLVKTLLNGTIVGISLKKTGKTAKVEVSNIEKKVSKAPSVFYEPVSLTCKMNLRGNLFESVETSLIIKDDNGLEVRTQARPFPLKARQNIQVEMTVKTAKARLGKVVKDGLLKIYQEYNWPAPTWRSVPKTWEEFEKEKTKWKRYWDLIHNKNFETKTNKNDFEKIMRTVYTASELNIETYVFSKLQSLEFAAFIASLNKEQQKDVLTRMVYLAKKETNDVGPFIKIY